MKTSKWINSAARSRNQIKFRRHLCRLACCPVDSCFTTGELIRDLRREREEHRDWVAAARANQRGENAFYEGWYRS